MTDKEKLEKLVAYLMHRMYAHNQMADIGSTGEIFDEKIENAKYEECRDTLNFIDSMQKEPATSLWHDASETPEIHRKFLVRFADGKINGSWERHDDGFIPWKDVVKEHKFTHWCYVEDLLKL